jgi:hypothetical protein
MDVEVRFVEGCPSLPVIRQRLRHALDAVGRAGVDVRLRVVHTDAEAEAEELAYARQLTLTATD